MNEKKHIYIVLHYSAFERPIINVYSLYSFWRNNLNFILKLIQHGIDWSQNSLLNKRKVTKQCEFFTLSHVNSLKRTSESIFMNIEDL